MIRLTFSKALRCSGCHTKGVTFFIKCRRDSEAWAMMGVNLFRELTILIKVCNSVRFCGEGMSVIAFKF